MNNKTSWFLDLKYFRSFQLPTFNSGTTPTLTSTRWALRTFDTLPRKGEKRMKKKYFIYPQGHKVRVVIYNIIFSVHYLLLFFYLLYSLRVFFFIFFLIVSLFRLSHRYCTCSSSSTVKDNLPSSAIVFYSCISSPDKHFGSSTTICWAIFSFDQRLCICSVRSKMTC